MPVFLFVYFPLTLLILLGQEVGQMFFLILTAISRLFSFCPPPNPQSSESHGFSFSHPLPVPCGSHLLISENFSSQVSITFSNLPNIILGNFHNYFHKQSFHYSDLSGLESDHLQLFQLHSTLDNYFLGVRPLSSTFSQLLTLIVIPSLVFANQSSPCAIRHPRSFPVALTANPPGTHSVDPTTFLLSLTPFCLHTPCCLA